MYNSSDYISVSSNTLSSALSSQYYTQSDTEAEEEIRCRKKGGVYRPGRLNLTPRETTLRKRRSLSSTQFPLCQLTPKVVQQPRMHALDRTLLPASSIESFDPLQTSTKQFYHPTSQRRYSRHSTQICSSLRKNNQNHPKQVQTRLNEYYRPTKRNPTTAKITSNSQKKRATSKRRHSNPFALLTDNNPGVEICSAPILLDYQPTPKPLRKVLNTKKIFPPQEKPPPAPQHQLELINCSKRYTEKENYVNTVFPSSCNDSGCDDERLEDPLGQRSYEETCFMNMSDKTYENLRMERQSVPCAASCSTSSSTRGCSRGTASDSAMSCSIATVVDDEPQLYGRLVGVVFTQARRLCLHKSNWRRIAEAQRQLEAVFGLSRAIYPSVDLAQPLMEDLIFCKNCALFCNRIAQRLRQTQGHSIKDYNYLVKKLQKVLSQLKMASEQQSSLAFNSAHGTLPKFLERIKNYFK